MLRRAVPGPLALPDVLPPDGRVRVGIHTPCLSHGGAERWIVDLLRACDRSRVQWVGVGVLGSGAWDPRRREEVEQTCPVFPGEDGARLLAENVDLLLTWGLPAWWRWVPESLWPRTVVVSHGSGIWSAGVMAGCERGLPVAVGRDALRAIPAGQQARARVIYNGVDDERLAFMRTREEWREAWGVPEDAPVLGYLARLSMEKHPTSVPEALVHLPGWHGVLCGAGNERFRVQRRAEELAVADRCHLAGFTEDVGGALRAFDVFLNPSDSEGFCYSLVEAWLCGVPAVSTPVGMAAERTDLVREVRIGATGMEIAAAVLCDGRFPNGTRWRVFEAQEFARSYLTLERFGAEWTALLLEVAQARPH